MESCTNSSINVNDGRFKDMGIKEFRDSKTINKYNHIINVLCILYLYYYSYRYILQYNFTGTSPTYSDTPLGFQIAKYAILLMIILYILVLSHGKIKFRRRSKMIGVMLILLILQMAVLGCLYNNTELIQFVMVFTPVIFLLSSNISIGLDIFENIIERFWSFSLFYEIIQMVLYFTIGRLPALAWNTGRVTDVRFGGAWDDPNGYAILLVFYITYFLLKLNGLKRLVYVGLSGFMLFFTWSLTGFISLVVTCCVLFLLKLGKNKVTRILLKMFILTFGLFLVVYILEFDKISNIYSYLLMTKAQSMKDHFAGWSMEATPLVTYIGLYPNDEFTEVGWVRLLRWGGVFSLFSFTFLTICCIKNCLHISKYRSDHYPLVIGILSYFIGFSIAMFNLPVISIFSCVGMWSIFLVVAVYMKDAMF